MLRRWRRPHPWAHLFFTRDRPQATVGGGASRVPGAVAFRAGGDFAHAAAHPVLKHAANDHEKDAEYELRGSNPGQPNAHDESIPKG